MPVPTVAAVLLVAAIAGTAAAAIAAMLSMAPGLPEPPRAGRTGTVRLEGAFDAPPAPGFVQPAGIAASAQRVLVADTGRGALLEFTASGRFVGLFGEGRLRTPAYVAIDPRDGSVCVTDRTAGSIVVFERDGAYRGVLPSPEGLGAVGDGRWDPLALAFDRDGTLYATRGGGGGIVVYPSGGASATVVAGSLDPPLAFANGIATAGDTLFVADSNNRRLLLLDRRGAVVKAVTFAGLARGACAVGDAAAPAFAVVDTTRGAVRIVDGADGSTLAESGEGFGLEYPTGIARVGGRMVVVDTGNRRVAVLGAPGLVGGVDPVTRWLEGGWATSLAVGLAVAVVSGAATFFLRRRKERARV